MVFDMMPGLAEEKAVDGMIRKQRIVRIGEDRYDVAHLKLTDAPIDIEDHIRTDIHRVNLSFLSHMMRQSEGEIAGASADVGNNFTGFDSKRRHDLLWLLISVSLRVFEYTDISFGIAVKSMHFVL